MRVIVGHREDLAGSALEWSGERPLTLGRSDAADVRVSDKGAAGLHLRLEVTAGIVYALDLGGPGGISVNGQRAERRQIDLGDTVTFGEACWVKLIDSGVTVAVRTRAASPPARAAETAAMPILAGDLASSEDLRTRAAAVTMREVRAPGAAVAPPPVDRDRTTEGMVAGTPSGNLPAARPETVEGDQDRTLAFQGPISGVRRGADARAAEDQNWTIALHGPAPDAGPGARGARENDRTLALQGPGVDAGDRGASDNDRTMAHAGPLAAEIRTDLTQPIPRLEAPEVGSETAILPPLSGIGAIATGVAPQISSAPIQGGDTAVLTRPGDETLALPAPRITAPVLHPPHQRWVEGFWVDEGLLPAPRPAPQGIVGRTARWFFGRRRRG